MTDGNPKLAEVLAQHGEPEELLRALVDGGVLIVTNPDGSVLVGQLEDETVALAAFSTPAAYSEKSEGEDFQHADAALLLEIARSGEVGALVIDPESDDAALVPLGDVQGYLVANGVDFDDDVEVAFRASEHTLVSHLKEGISERLSQYPTVERVWISDVRMPSGVEGLMLHVVVAGDADPKVANELLQSTMEALPDSDVPVFAHVADDESEEFLAEMEAAVVRR